MTRLRALLAKAQAEDLRLRSRATPVPQQREPELRVHEPPDLQVGVAAPNPRYVETDIEDWKPDGIGKTQRMNADRWGRDPIKWRIYWMQAIPGLTYQGKKLRNWWSLMAEWDRAKREKWTLVLPYGFPLRVRFFEAQAIRPRPRGLGVGRHPSRWD